MIELPALGGIERELWHALLDLAERHPDNWTLIGGQMVLLRAVEQGRVPPRVTRDLDVLADLRARPAALPRLVAALAALDFEVELAVPGESGHRFKRDDVTIDLLAPDKSRAGHHCLERTARPRGERDARRGRRALTFGAEPTRRRILRRAA